jgi:hypothetical protein
MSAAQSKRRSGMDARPAGTEHGRELPALACSSETNCKYAIIT